MAPTSISNWKRPYTSIYNDNYRYGTGLYSDTLTDIEKRYSDSLSRTQLRADRPDVGFTTFAGSSLTTSPTPGEPQKEPLQRQVSILDEIASERKASSRLLKEAMSEMKRPKSLYDDSDFWTLPKPLHKEPDLEDLMSKKTTTNGPSQWREKSRILQEQVETLENAMSSCDSRLQSELSTLKGKYQSEVSDLSHSVEQSTQEAAQLHKLCKRQAQQILDLESAYETSQRNVSDALQEVSLWQNKCNSIKKEMNRLREEIELSLQRKSRD